jgi:hypothetical protein
MRPSKLADHYPGNGPEHNVVRDLGNKWKCADPLEPPADEPQVEYRYRKPCKSACRHRSLPRKRRCQHDSPRERKCDTSQSTPGGTELMPVCVSLSTGLTCSP